MRSLLRAIRHFLSELRHRNVYRVAGAYLVAGFVVVELADIAAGTFDLPGWFGPMVWVVVGLGFPIALVMAWALEVTPDGVRVEEAEGAKETRRSSAGFSFTSNWLIVGLLIVAIGLLLYPRLFSSQEGTGGQGSAPDTVQIDERSIAVLPFSNLSGTDKARPLVRGLHDDLLTRLSNVSDLKVISRTSVEKYRDTDLSLPAIADSLGVRWIVEGGVQQANDQIQVNAQLIDPESDVHRWADSYQRDLSAEDLFAIQGEIAGEITEALEAQLTPEEQERIAGAPTENLQAYRLYVEGRKLLASRTPDSIRRAQRYFEKALRQDSTYALAWAGLADAYLLHDLAEPETPPHETKAALDQARAAARQGREINPNLAEAWTATGAIEIYEYRAGLDRGDGPRALKALRRAVNLKPSDANAQQWLGELYLHLGRPKQGLEHASLAVELNPQHVGARVVLIWALLANGQFDKTSPHLQKLPTGLRSLLAFDVFYHEKRWNELEQLAQEELKSEDGIPHMWRFGLARVATLRGDTARARKQLTKASQQDDPKEEGYVYAALGEEEKALAAWETVERWPDVSAMTLRYLYPDVLDPLRDDPEFEELIREINMSWGLNPDGSLPEDTQMATDLQSDA